MGDTLIIMGIAFGIAIPFVIGARLGYWIVGVKPIGKED